MNLVHRWLCRSARWRKVLGDIVVPWVLEGLDLGDQILEVGPGPGLTTDLLRRRTQRVTALEIDSALAHSLGRRLRGTNVDVIQGDGAAMPFEDARFSGAVSFTMLHHVPSAALQDQLLREVRRVLQPGGIFAGVDLRQSLGMRILHFRDTLVPVDPGSLGSRLESAGFADASVDVNPYAFRFRAQRIA